MFSGPRHGGEIVRKKTESKNFWLYGSPRKDVVTATYFERTSIGPALSKFRPSVGDGAT